MYPLLISQNKKLAEIICIHLSKNDEDNFLENYIDADLIKKKEYEKLIDQILCDENLIKYDREHDNILSKCNKIWNFQNI